MGRGLCLLAPSHLLAEEYSLLRDFLFLRETRREMAASVWFFWMASLGAIQVFALSIRLLANLVLFLRRPKDLCRTYGAWAVVTGPTSGIGRAMSLELARSGLNLVLVGRDPTRLREISETISRTYAMQTKTVLFDFSLVSTAQGIKVWKSYLATVRWQMGDKRTLLVAVLVMRQD